VPEQLARRLREVLANPALRARMSSAGLERARLYSWMQSARLNLRIIREILCGI
jgi:glycosyltransferase involved in cell wall biosynthesis